jgi:hypothetical protein
MMVIIYDHHIFIVQVTETPCTLNGNEKGAVLEKKMLPHTQQNNNQHIFKKYSGGCFNFFPLSHISIGDVFKVKTLATRDNHYCVCVGHLGK